MLVLLTDVRDGYAAFLAQRGVAQIYVITCQKWLRYYLDFCKKSRHETATSRGLDAFLVKVPGKKQNSTARKAAQRAIQLYQDFLIANRSYDRRSKRPEKCDSVSVAGKYTIKRTDDRNTRWTRLASLKGSRRTPSVTAMHVIFFRQITIFEPSRSYSDIAM